LIDKGTPNVLRKINVEDLVEGVTMPEMPYAKGRIRKGVDVANGLTRRGTDTGKQPPDWRRWYGLY